MAAHETYVLHIYRSRAVRGWQWAARLEHLPDRASLRFSDPEALLAHLRTAVRLEDHPVSHGAPPSGAQGATPPEEGGTQDEDQ